MLAYGARMAASQPASCICGTRTTTDFSSIVNQAKLEATLADNRVLPSRGLSALADSDLMNSSQKL